MCELGIYTRILILYANSEVEYDMNANDVTPWDGDQGVNLSRTNGGLNWGTFGQASWDEADFEKKRSLCRYPKLRVPQDKVSAQDVRKLYFQPRNFQMSSLNEWVLCLAIASVILFFASAPKTVC